MSILQDSRFALRLLAKARVSTAIAILSLALGIGATTAIFSVVYAVLVDPYPYADADRIGGRMIGALRACRRDSEHLRARLSTDPPFTRYI